MHQDHGPRPVPSRNRLSRSGRSVTHSGHTTAQMAATIGWRTRRAGTNEVGNMSDWTSFGRVDSDGTVYVKTAAGERVVGSWQAGTPEEGLAHFARRFADIVTEVDLIEARLGTGAADAGHTVASLR